MHHSKYRAPPSCLTHPALYNTVFAFFIFPVFLAQAILHDFYDLMVMDLHLLCFWATDYSKHFTTHASFMSSICMYIHLQVLTTFGLLICSIASSSNWLQYFYAIRSHRWNGHGGKFDFHCLAQGHAGLAAGAGDQTTDHLIIGGPALPPGLQDLVVPSQFQS